MTDRFTAMSIFLKVVEQGSFSAAGRALQMPVPTLSRRITDLETHLHARLFIRTTRKLTLTDAGLAYAEASRRIIEQVQEAEQQAAGEFVTPRGDLVLSAPIHFGRLYVLPVVTDFLAAFPDINVRLVLSDRNVHLMDDHVDMAVRIGALPDSGMMATAIGTMRHVICASPALLDGYGVPQIPQDLMRMPTVAIDTPSGQPTWRLRDQHEIAIKPRLAVSTAEAAAEAAIRHVGAVRLLFYQVADAVAAGRLALVLTTFEPEPSPIHLIHVARGQMPLKMRCFMDFAVPRLRQALGLLDQS